MTDTASIFETAGTTTEDIRGSIYGDDEPQPDSPFINPSEDKKPDKHAVRVSGQSMFANLSFFVGGQLIGRKIDPPVGRVIQFQAPLAAQKIDQAIAYSWIDRLLQPIFRAFDSVEGMGALGLPILIGALERKPEWAPMLEQPIRELVGITIDEVVPIMRKAKTQRRTKVRSLGDISDVFQDLPRGVDPVDAFMAFIFQDVIQPQEEEKIDS